MPPHPDDPMTTTNYNSFRPRNLEDLLLDTARNRSDEEAVPRYVPNPQARSSTSNNLNASPTTPNFEISSRHGSRYRDEDVEFSGGWSDLMERHPMNRAIAASNSPLPRMTTKPCGEEVLENDDFQKTWNSLAALFGCISLEEPSPRRQPPLLSSPVGVRERPRGNSTRSGQPRADPSTLGTGANQGRGSNSNGDRLPPTDEENDAEDQDAGDEDNDQQSTHHSKLSPRRAFACPFHKFNPVQYAACHEENFQRIDSLWRVSLMDAK
ncbi:hypothetical protein LTR84_003741 [Exophiala bonariae]|uniref:Uncharacterized protein n=1 Tax=Exophiala bonariae TaxID=1690606 RepID=A0AAV9N8W8_9EURO|nr:hypothetical protein LTR84_003741 [Exophiala bonariae]